MHGAELASADAFVFPSTTDTFGNVILEAQASGLPCVVSDQGGPCELVTDGEDGFITRGGDLNALCEAVKKLCTTPELRHSMALASRRRVENRNWPNAVQKLGSVTKVPKTW